ncbi:MAG: polysaccharide deacetylase family protein [Clostridia bacterium]|nr:polysaccharide deacetylase family protein [Clostridia bacterium]
MSGFFALLLSGALLLFGSAQPPGRSCYFNDEEHRVFAGAPKSDGQISLTFDDGPHEEYTEEILDILKEYHVKATFFIIGENAQRHPQIVQRIKREGHCIGNHTYSHDHIARQSKETFLQDVRKNQQLLEHYTAECTLFRPPEGVCDEKVLSVSNDFDYDIILWTVDTGDWRAPAKEQIVQTVLDHVKSGDIILMHDYVAGKSHTPDALRVLLPQLLEQGYTFVTVKDLIA